MADDIGTMAVKVTAITEPLKAGLNQAIQNLKQFEAQVGKTAAPAGFKDVTAGVKDLSKDLDKVTAKAAAAKTSLASIAVKGLVAGGSFGAALVGLDVLSSVKDFAFDSVQAAADAEKMAASFEVLTGSAGKAQEVIDKLRTYAKDSPLGTDTVLNTAKQLAAYGISADQLAPTLRMLGDAAAGDSERLKSIALAYGQVATAGRIMGDDLRQFNAAGVPLAEELAKGLGKPKEMIKLLVEEGKVGFPDVVKAFKSMTGEGGRFFGMSEKYAGTFAGSMENLTDAWQTLKREFGTAVIEETGLKEATKDLSAFTDRVRAGVNEVRPAIRFVGDLGKAASQGGNELAKSSGAFLDIQFQSLQKAFPGLGTFAQDAKSFVKSLGEVKFDPKSVISAGADFAVLLVTGAEGIERALSSAWKEADEKFLGPFGRIVDRMDKSLGWFDKAEKWYNENLAPVTDQNRPRPGSVEEGLFKTLNPSFNRLLAKDAAKDAAARAKSAGFGLIPPVTSDDGRGAMNFGAGGNADNWLAKLPPPGPPKTPFDRAKDVVYEVRDKALAIATANAARQAADKMADMAARNYVPGAALVGGAFDAVAESARKAARELGKVEVPSDTHARAIQLGSRLNEQLRDPLDKFDEQLQDISFLASKGIIDDRTRSLAVAGALDDAAKGLGSLQLPSAAEHGSHEAAKLAAWALTPDKGSDDAVSLLTEIRDYEKAREQRAQRLEGQIIDNRLNGLSELQVFDW